MGLYGLYLLEYFLGLCFREIGYALCFYRRCLNGIVYGFSDTLDNLFVDGLMVFVCVAFVGVDLSRTVGLGCLLVA